MAIESILAAGGAAGVRRLDVVKPLSAVDAERASRLQAENALQVALIAKAEAEAAQIREKALREAAEARANEAERARAQVETAHRAECDAHEQTRADVYSLREQLATAKAGEQVAKEALGQLRREKQPAQPQAQKPVAYTVGGVQRDGNGRITSMNITPGS
jgi:hypothetical protein